VLASALGVAACNKDEELSPVPSILLQALEPREVKAASQDTVFLQFRFTDGDGDLGVDRTTGRYDIYLKDRRNDDTLFYTLPDIPDETRDAVTGALKGTATVLIQTAFLLPRDSLHAVTGDTLSYEFWIEDRAGNQSNKVITPEIFLLPP